MTSSRSMDCSEHTQLLHGEELDQLKAVVKSAVTSALAEALSAETDKLRNVVESAFAMLRTISSAMSSADDPGACRSLNRMPQVTEEVSGEQQSPIHTLEHVREKLFNEIMQEKPSPPSRSLSSGDEEAPRRHTSKLPSRSSKKSSSESKSNSSNASQDPKSNSKPSQDQPDENLVRGEKNGGSETSQNRPDENLAEAKKTVSKEGTRGASQGLADACHKNEADTPNAQALAPNIPGLVPPPASQDQPDDVIVFVEKDGPQFPSFQGVPQEENLDFPESPVPVVPGALPNQVGPFVVKVESNGRKTAGAANENIQKLIINTSCDSIGASADLDLKYKVVPLIRFIINRLFLCRMSLLLIVILGTAIRVVLRFQYNSPIYIVRDVAALVFAIAAVLACTQLTHAQCYIDHMNSWAKTHALSETWSIVSLRRQHGLLAWWALTLFFVLPGEIGIVYQFFDIAHNDNIETGCLWAAEILTCLTFLLSSSLLLSAAFVQYHIISALDVFIDAWSCELCEKRDFFEGVVSWNTVQALICRAGSSFENVFAIIQTFGLLGCVALATQGIGFALHPDWSLTGLMSIACILPLLLLVALAGSLLLQCSCITDKCSTLAPLANQIMTEAMDKERQYLVRFLTDSAAGICIKGVRLDMVLVVNVVYFVMVAVTGFFGLAIRLSGA